MIVPPPQEKTLTFHLRLLSFRITPQRRVWSYRKTCHPLPSRSRALTWWEGWRRGAQGQWPSRKWSGTPWRPRTAAAHLAGHLPPQADGRFRQCIVQKQCPGQHRNRSLPSQWRSQRQWQTGQGSTLSPRQRMLPVVSPKWPRSKLLQFQCVRQGQMHGSCLGLARKQSRMLRSTAARHQSGRRSGPWWNREWQDRLKRRGCQELLNFEPGIRWTVYICRDLYNFITCWLMLALESQESLLCPSLPWQRMPVQNIECNIMQLQIISFNYMLLQSSLSAPSINVLLTSSDVPVLIHIDVPWHVKLLFPTHSPAVKAARKDFVAKLS